MFLRLFSITGAFLAFTTIAACSGGRDTPPPPDAGASDVAAPDVGTVDPPPIIPPCAPPCSADLRDVLACDGTVRETCSPDTACVEGVCMPGPCAVTANAKTSYGCEFWSVSVVNFPSGACSAAYVANIWSAPVHITVEYNGTPLPVERFARLPSGQGSAITYQPYDPVGGLQPGDVAVLFLAQAGQAAPPVGVPCPRGVETALNFDPTVQGTGIGRGFHIRTDYPIAAYQIQPYGGGTAARTYATLLLPTSVWGENYVTATATTADPFPTFAIVASEDDTRVTIAPVTALSGGPGVDPAPAGMPTSYDLDRGQVLQFTEFQGELSGFPILADKPIGVFGGNACIGINGCCCDNAGQQVPPIRALGHEYAAVPYRSRRPGMNEQVPWKIVGAVDGTMLTYEPFVPTGAPAMVSAGQVVNFAANAEFLVASQDADHPFYLAAFMSGGGNFAGEGDPEFVNVVPAGQYLNRYVFFADPTYSETNVVLVRRRAQASADIILDCSGIVAGWQPLGPFEFTRVDLVTGNFESVGGCSNGRRQIGSSAPFGATVWGWGSSRAVGFDTTYVSYAYPAGMGVRQLSQTEFSPLI